MLKLLYRMMIIMRIIHLLNWNLNDVRKHLDQIAYQNFDAIQITPIQTMKEDCIKHWWMSYQPTSFEIGNVYGSKEDLINLCRDAQLRNLKIYADVICNHMAGKNDGSLFPHENVDPKLRNDPLVWKEAKAIDNWDDRHQVINYCLGLPGLNLSNENLQNKIIAFLNELVDCGIDGFRFDAAKNIALPSEGLDFWPKTIYSLKKYPLFLYGELIFLSYDLAREYSQYLKILTNESHLESHNLVKFTESHDSFYEFAYTKDLSSRELINQYATICSHYEHTLYFPRPFDDSWKSCELREANKQKKLKR